MKVIEELAQTIRKSAEYNSDIQAAPVCILWPDGERQWETAVPLLMGVLPELFALGEYSPEKRTGPAIWLRTVIAGLHKEILDEPSIPILYLPGISRQDIRAVDQCPGLLKPIVELQYRGSIWSQVNSRDWSVLAYLMATQGGLGLKVAKDNATKNALQLALPELLEKNPSLLRNRRLDADFFNTLLAGGDFVRDLLRWMDLGEQYVSEKSEGEWKALIDLCKTQLAFDLLKHGELGAAERLAIHDGPWMAVWDRYCEAPNRYPNIPDKIRRCTPPSFDLFANPSNEEGWPQRNSDQESKLRLELKGFSALTASKARDKLLELERSHGHRRNLVWSELGMTPLADSLIHLAVVAENTVSGLDAGSIDDLVAGYSAQGWRTDDAFMRALGCLNTQEDQDAVSTALREMYMDWADNSSAFLQKYVLENGYPGGSCVDSGSMTVHDGECFLFIDGLRYDVAKRLSEKLKNRNYSIEETITWAALPSVTATAKPAVSPVREKIIGEEISTEFEPSVKRSGKSLKGGYQLKKLLKDSGYQLLTRNDPGTGSGYGWCEYGNIDHEGHERGCDLGRYIEELLNEIVETIGVLFASGWKSIRIVTDHGWLLLPGGLPKQDLPSDVAESKWGRSAILKEGASTKLTSYPWYWNPNIFFVLPDGISCFTAGREFSHGGISLQECLNLELIVTGSGVVSTNAYTFADVVWRGMRCTVSFEGESKNAYFDIQKVPGNNESSIILMRKELKSDRATSVVVEDEDLSGSEATLVVISNTGEVLAQKPTIVGGGQND